MKAESIFSKIVYGLFIGGSLLVCMLFYGLSYQRKELSAQKGISWVFLAAGIGMTVLVWILLKRLDRKPGPSFWRKMLAASVLLLLLQIVVVRSYYFESDWDARALRRAAMAIADGRTLEKQYDYFSMYPNNLFLVWLFSLLARLRRSFFVVVVFQCCICQISGLLLLSVVLKRYENLRTGFMAYFLYVCLVGLSPWVCIPYSDATGLIFPVLTVWLYETKRYKYPFLKWGLAAFVSYIGYKIKPQVFILFLAIVLHALLSHRISVRRYWKPAVSAVAGLLAAMFLTNAAISTVPVRIDETKSFGWQHFLMMGMNYESQGVWNEEDVDFTAGIEDPEERNARDLELAKERVEKMGAAGLAKHLVHKTLINYNDGTFCWGYEGKFFVNMIPSGTPVLQKFFRSVYYNRSGVMGKNYKYWNGFAKAMWLSALLFSLASLLEKGNRNAAVYFAIVGLTVFELLFEARARYLYTYVPLYILLAVSGISAASAKVSERKKKKAPPVKAGRTGIHSTSI